MKGQSSYTERGFELFCDLVDSYGHRVRVQQSSNAEIVAAWIFCTDDEVTGPAPHLTVEQAREVRDGLDEFIKRFENSDSTVQNGEGEKK